jgi:LemA protein
MSTGKIIALGVVGVLLFGVLSIGGWMISSYNGMMTAKQDTLAKWGQVENQMQRRGDLIPQLVETVRGYAIHEQSAIDSVTEARAKLANAQTPAQKNEANGDLSNALSRLLMISENYPNLKADKHFTDLMREISGTENRIAVARGDYNNSVQAYNVRIQRFPGTILAVMYGYQPMDQFKAEESAKAVPKVDFNNLGQKPASK